LARKGGRGRVEAEGEEGGRGRRRPVCRALAMRKGREGGREGGKE